MSKRKEITLMIDAPSTSWNPGQELYMYISHIWPLRLRWNVFGIRINSSDQPRPPLPTDCTRHPRLWTASHLNCSRQEKTLGKQTPEVQSPPKLPISLDIQRFAGHVLCVISADRCIAPSLNARALHPLAPVRPLSLSGIFAFL